MRYLSCMSKDANSRAAAENRYKLADDNYLAWKKRNPGVDAWTDPVGRSLAEERDSANAKLVEEYGSD